MARKGRTKRATSGGGVTRPRIVWGALLASMVGVGALLGALEGRPMLRPGGLALPALAAPAGFSSIESVFATSSPLDRARWKSIVIHGSGEPFGTPASIEAQHVARNARGLGHHFLIGNGNGLEDGEIHVGYRWMQQLPGAHALGEQQDKHNLYSISICLVGNGERHRYTEAQMSRLVALVDALAREFQIPRDRRHILLHSDISPVAGDPGRFFSSSAFWEQLGSAR